ncbi:Transcriptional regulatory protein CitB [Sulfitobacter sp. THAF37]|uniref:response regulator n=1 Tax=Sulfitobacter sp. THAF37 TaxID=2587855 RepID=UPI00126928DC|nr:response regulator [Sulfitobacter sp. THAF37]QFT58623.1 Transcriptional regulatory protein CitB [Sulfitobacter sp. THAF37]
MDSNETFSAQLPQPTAARPLLGLTVLVIEDSRYACEAMRLLCLRSGARIRRADCLRSARRHLQVYRPSVVVIDLGLPDGDGTDLIAELANSTPRIQALLAVSGDTHLEADALSAGADGFLAKPILSIATFQEKVLSLLPEDRQPSGPRVLDTSVVTPDRIALQDDMAHIAEVLEDPPDAHALDYVTQFLTGVARLADDEPLEKASVALAAKRALGEAAASEAATLAGMLQQRLSHRMAI